jgi:hypothetical protein
MQSRWKTMSQSVNQIQCAAVARAARLRPIARVLGGVVDGHAHARLRRREVHQRRELVGQQVGILPAVAHDLDVEHARARGEVLGPRRLQEPARRDDAGRRDAQEPLLDAVTQAQSGGLLSPVHG